MFGRKRKLDDFTSEIEAHVQLEIERLREQGLSEEQARATARRSFGNLMQAEERFYESGRWLWWDHFCQDVRYGLRMLRKSPGFAAITVLTIALGIGATTAIFTVVDATLLRPLPYPQPEQLVSVEDDLPGVGARDVGMSQPEWQDLQRSGIFEYVSPTWFDENNLTGSSQPARVRSAPSIPRITPPGFCSKFSSAMAFGSGPSGATRTFWTKVSGSTPTCIGSSASCRRGLTCLGEKRKKGISTPGSQPAFTARLCLIILRATGGIFRQQSPALNLD